MKNQQTLMFTRGQVDHCLPLSSNYLNSLKKYGILQSWYHLNLKDFPLLPRLVRLFERLCRVLLVWLLTSRSDVPEVGGWESESLDTVSDKVPEPFRGGLPPGCWCPDRQDGVKLTWPTKNIKNKTVVISDPLGHSHSPTSSNRYSQLNFFSSVWKVVTDIRKSLVKIIITTVRDFWFGRVDQK